MNINLQSMVGDSPQYTVKGENLNVQNPENVEEKIGTLDELNLKELSVGDIFRGKIINITNYDVEILLDNQQHVKAAIQQALEFNIGDKLIFQIKDKSDGKIFIKPMTQDGISMDLVKRSLDAAGFTATDKNINIVKSLIANEQPINKQSIFNMIKFTSTFGIENVDKLVDMTKNGIEVNENNLQMYDSYLQSKHQITSDINNLQNQLVKFMMERIDISSEDNSNITPEILNGKVDEEIEWFSKMLEEPDNNENAIRNDEPLLKDNVKIQETVLQEGGKYSEAVLSENPEKTETILPKVELPLTKDVKDIETSLTGNLKNSETVLPEIGKNVEYKDRLSRLISKIFEKEFFLEPEELLENKDTIKEQVEKIYDKLNKLSEVIENQIDTSKNNGLSESAAGVKNNMNFMNELNNIESYVQLPIKFSEGKANGDLYVYNKKNRKYDKEEVLTAFLHLDMQYLGATDVNIKMERKNVTAKFTLEDDTSMRIVDEHLNELIEKIEKAGYSIKMTTEVMNKLDRNPLQPITEHNEAVVNVKRYTLDIRT